MFGTEIIITDPEGEYEAITTTMSGEYVSVTSSSPIKITPFDLSGMYVEGENELGVKILSLHGLMRVIMGELSPSEDAILDRALVLTYKQKGITPDPATQKSEPPLIEDLYKTLLGMEEESAKRLAERLEKFVKGSLSGIFNQKSNVALKNPLTVFNIKELEAELDRIAEAHPPKQRRWTPKELEILKNLRARGVSATVMASVLKRSKTSVTDKMGRI
jgi:type IV secretory pathway VirB4 component